MLIRAQGLLAHHFWGEYRATVALKFQSRELREIAHKVLPQWSLAKREDHLVWHGTSKDLEAIIAQLVSFGADRKAIDSIAKSVDHGEPFSIAIEAEDPRQRSLPL